MIPPPSHRRRLNRRRPTLYGGLALVGALIVGSMMWASEQRLPPGALDLNRLQSRRLLDRRGLPLRVIPPQAEGGARYVPLAGISVDLISATLVAEDRRFFSHSGVDGLAVARAIALNWVRGKIVSGASTLTMQLVKLVRPEKRGFVAKARQAVLALSLERQLSKFQILEQYLNRAPYGRRCFGVGAAARRYFDVSAQQLSLAQAAVLAALPRAPSFYGHTKKGHARLIARQRSILLAMHRLGLLTDQRLIRALLEPVRFTANPSVFLAPHFTSAIAHQGKTGERRTTIHMGLQRRVQLAAQRTIAGLKDRGVSNAAVLVVDNLRGDVLAHVGSIAFDDRQGAGQVDGTQALRQPGSSIKPFVYQLALEDGASLATLLEDQPAHFPTTHGTYSPRNYDGEFHGPVRLRVALASSLNIPAVRLAKRVGVQRLLVRLRLLGFKGLQEKAEHYGLGLALGNGEVTLEQLVTAYTTLARGGRYLPLRRFLDTPQVAATVLLDPQATRLISMALADPQARSIGFGRDGPLETPFGASVKTGTSKDFRDNWTVGYTRELTVGVWVGNFDARPMHRVSGVSGAAPLWREVFEAALDELQLAPRPRGPSADMKTLRICTLSGAIAGRLCPTTSDEYFRAGNAPTTSCAMHRYAKIDRRNGLGGDACEAKHIRLKAVVSLPPRYRPWGLAQGLADAPTAPSPLCRKVGRSMTDASAPRISYPFDGATFVVDPDLKRSYQRIPLEAEIPGGVAAVTWLVNGHPIATAPFPYDASWALKRGKHRLTIRLPDGRETRGVKFQVR